MQISRLFQIVYYLLEHGKSTASELAEKFEVSTRTIYRDLDALSAAGIPIYAAQGKGGGISLMENYVLHKSFFSAKEQEQILMALHGISSTKGEHAEELISKLSALFQIKNTDWIEVDFSDWNSSEAGRDVFDQIKQAIFDRHVIRFSYFGADGQRLSRSVEPIKLIFKSRDWYLYGYCRLRNGYRFFKLTRIKDLLLSPEAFTRKEPEPPKKQIENKPGSTVPVSLKFSPRAAFRVYDEFPDRVTTDAENNLYVTTDLPDHELIYQYLLTFGDTVEVLAPAHIREAMKKKAYSILKLYET